MSDAIAIARHILWADREQAHFDEHGESYDPSNPKPAFDEPDRLRAELTEALRYLDDHPSVGTAADVARIAELRRLANGE